MAVNYAMSLKTARMNAINTAIGAAGILEICSAAYASVLAAITLASPNPFSVSNDIATLLGVPLQDASANASGTAAIARIKTAGGTVIVSGLTVGVGSGDIQLSSVDIAATQTVTITAGALVHAT